MVFFLILEAIAWFVACYYLSEYGYPKETGLVLIGAYLLAVFIDPILFSLGLFVAPPTLWISFLGNSFVGGAGGLGLLSYTLKKKELFIR